MIAHYISKFENEGASNNFMNGTIDFLHYCHLRLLQSIAATEILNMRENNNYLVEKLSSTTVWNIIRKMWNGTLNDYNMTLQ